MYPQIVLIEDCTNHCSKKWMDFRKMGHCPSIRITTLLSVWFSPKFSLIDYMYWKIKEKFLWNHRCKIIQKSYFKKVTSKEWIQKATSKKPLKKKWLQNNDFQKATSKKWLQNNNCKKAIQKIDFITALASLWPVCEELWPAIAIEDDLVPDFKATRSVCCTALRPSSGFLLHQTHTISPVM